MRLLSNGVLDFAFALPGYVAAENAVFEAGDLSSLTQDIETQRTASDADFPILEKAVAETYDTKLLLQYSSPSNMLWCEGEVNRIDDLASRKIRAYSTSLGHLVEGVGATSVTIPFTEVTPALEKDAIDHGITGTMPAYKANWHPGERTKAEILQRTPAQYYDGESDRA